MLFSGHPVYEIAKSGRKIGFSALELGYIGIFVDLAQKLLSVRSISRFFFGTLCMWNIKSDFKIGFSGLKLLYVAIFNHLSQFYHKKLCDQRAKSLFFQFLMLFLTHCAYEIAKSGLKIGLSALEFFKI